MKIHTQLGKKRKIWNELMTAPTFSNIFLVKMERNEKNKIPSIYM